MKNILFCMTSVIICMNLSACLQNNDLPSNINAEEVELESELSRSTIREILDGPNSGKIEAVYEILERTSRQRNVNLILDDLYITSFIKGGVTVQQSPQGAAIFIQRRSFSSADVGKKIKIKVKEVKKYQGKYYVNKVSVLSTSNRSYDLSTYVTTESDLQEDDQVMHQWKIIKLGTVQFIQEIDDQRWIVKSEATDQEFEVYLPSSFVPEICEHALVRLDHLLGRINRHQFMLTLLSAETFEDFDDFFCIEEEVPPVGIDRFIQRPAVLSLKARSYWRQFDTTASGSVFLERLSSRIEHSSIGYRQLMFAYRETDGQGFGGCPRGKIWDIYSSTCFSRGNVCRSYTEEGECYNREHVWAKGWWDRIEDDRFSDLHHVLPSDGFVNGMRGSKAFGRVEAGTETYISIEGHKVGTCDNGVDSEDCFEPADAIKGDIARALLYFSTRYRETFECCTRAAVDGHHINEAMEEELKLWVLLDPVSEREMMRNDAVQDIQGNRNPFIDHPEWVFKINDF